jgi:hypothetical protein
VNAIEVLHVANIDIDPFAQALASEGFAIAVDRYLERRRSTLKPSSFKETERNLRNHSAPLHRLRLDQIDRRKVAALLGEVETSAGPVARNRTRSALSWNPPCSWLDRASAARAAPKRLHWPASADNN